MSYRKEPWTELKKVTIRLRSQFHKESFRLWLAATNGFYIFTRR